MTSPSMSPDPATNGRASLSPGAPGRFPHRLRYRAQADHLRGGNVAIVFDSASFTSPRLYRQEQFWSDEAAIGTDACASLVARRRTPVSTGPFGLVGKLPQHLTQRGRGEGLRQPRADQPFQAEVFDSRRERCLAAEKMDLCDALAFETWVLPLVSHARSPLHGHVIGEERVVRERCHKTIRGAG